MEQQQQPDKIPKWMKRQLEQEAKEKAERDALSAKYRAEHSQRAKPDEKRREKEQKK